MSIPMLRFLALAGALAIALPSASLAEPSLTRAEVEAIVRDHLAKHPEEVQRIVKDYISKNPDVIQDAFAELIKRQMLARAPQASDKTAPDRAAAIRSNADAIFKSAHQVTLGNPQGDVTLVEFFDYNCGYCKRALADKLELLKTDAKLRIVLKEWPVLGPGSVEAAQVAVAVRMQDAGGQKYLAFHERLLGAREPANKAAALAAAADAGFDVARIERDLTSPEITDTLDESRRLAGVLGITGTPSYVIGEQVVAGAVGLRVLSDRIRTQRQ